MRLAVGIFAELINSRADGIAPQALIRARTTSEE
jgi:hypothetical protein